MHQRTDSTFSLQFASDLQSLVGTLEGAFVDNPLNPPNRSAEMKPGEVRTYPELPHWRFYRLSTSELKDKPRSAPYCVSCTPDQAEDLRKRLVANNLVQSAERPEIPGLAFLRQHGLEPKTKQDIAGTWLPPIEIPYQPRRSFPSKEAAWDWARSLSPTKIMREGVASEIPADIMAISVEIALLWWNDPDARGADPKAVTRNGLASLKGKARTCKELALAYLKFYEPTLDLDWTEYHDIAKTKKKGLHLQFPDGWRRQRAFIVFDFVDFFGDLPHGSVTDEMAEDFISFVLKRRGMYYTPEKTIKRSSIEKNLGSISALFGEYGEKRHDVKSNPFFKFKVRIKHRMPGTKPVPKPHSIEEISSLLFWAWKIDKQMYLAMVLSCLCGLRRGEMLKSLNSAINLDLGCVTVTPYAAKKNPKGVGTGRVIYFPRVVLEHLRKLEYGAPNEPLLGDMDKKEYGKRLWAVREAAFKGQPHLWNKDKMRHDFSIRIQYLGVPLKDRKKELGHTPESRTTEADYNGDSSPEWAHAVLKLYPDVTIGADAPFCTLEERMRRPAHLKPLPKRRKKPEPAAAQP